MTPRLRIAMVSPYSLDVPGGVQEQAQGLAAELSDRGHEVTLVSPGGGSPDGEERSGVRQLRVGRVVSVPANGSEAKLTLSLWAARAAAARLADQGADVVHLHEPLTPVLGWAFLRSGPMGVVGTFHRSGVDPLYRIAGRLLHRRVGALDATAAVSAAAAATATEVLGVEPEVLFNGIDQAALEGVVPWPTEGPTVLFLGRDEQRKGRDVLLEAAASLPGDVTIWATGAPPRSPWRSAGARVEFLGMISHDEKVRRLRAASALCAPSLGGESFGIVLLEAMAAGTPVVCSDIDGYRQAIAGCGITVPPGDASALATALREVIARPSPDLVERGRRRAAMWSLPALADHYELLYERARSAGRSRRSG